MIAVVIAPAIVATMIETDKIAINESSSPHLHDTSCLPKRARKLGLPGGELILSIVLPLSIRIFCQTRSSKAFQMILLLILYLI
jgi:hypothetical protein